MLIVFMIKALGLMAATIPNITAGKPSEQRKSLITMLLYKETGVQMYM